MNKNQGFEIIYYSEIPRVATRSIASDFIVRTDTAPPAHVAASIDAVNTIPVGNSVLNTVAIPTAAPAASERYP